MVDKRDNQPEVVDKHHDKQSAKPHEQQSSELAVANSQTLNELKTIFQRSDQLSSESTDQFLPPADSVIADARAIEGNEQAWAQGKVPIAADSHGYHQSENIVVKWPPGYDPRQHAGEQFGDPTKLGNTVVNIAEIPPVPGKNNYWNALANPYIDAQGHLCGTPMHIERGPAKHLPNGQTIKGDITYYSSSRVQVSCENHYPQKKHSQKTADA